MPFMADSQGKVPSVRTPRRNSLLKMVDTAKGRFHKCEPSWNSPLKWLKAKGTFHMYEPSMSLTFHCNPRCNSLLKMVNTAKGRFRKCEPSCNSPLKWLKGTFHWYESSIQLTFHSNPRSNSLLKMVNTQPKGGFTCVNPVVTHL